MDVYDIRRTKLRILIGTHGRTTVAAAAETNADYLSQLAGPNPTRNVGHEIARRIERVYGMKKGWMDTLGEDDGLFDADSLEGRMLHSMRSLSSKEQAAILSFIDTLVKPETDTEES